MLFLVCYDVNTTTPAGRRRLSRVSRYLARHGTRAQRSVFEVRMPAESFRIIRASLLDLIDPRVDSLRVYTLDREAADSIEHHGAREPMELFGVLFFD